ncbi:hypothetical protein BaRGS_00018933 [Batillaria attramentaria]|uniref:BHLH domain-containing protein n=1 Tax=Batillaria attramentaria TaxID=370345 RepID=A0ABD0KRI4_9CAEN
MKKEEVPVKHQDSDRAADMTSSSSCPQEADYDSSAVLISDDDSSESALKAPSQRFESKRSRLKRKMFSSEKDTSGSAQPVSANSHMTSTSPPMPPHAVPVSSQQPPPPADKVASSPPYSTSRWHTSMVCLKANPVMRSKDKSDDVQEEDEIKLLEFITNCNWDVAKRDILYRVAGCLTRGHYPNPRVMFVSDFRVEILPKAARPSVIPPELRNRLPEMMFSIRVRVTQYKNTHTAVPVNLVKNTAAAGLTSSAAASNEPPVPGVTPASSVKAAQPGGAPAAPSTDGKSAGSMGISGLGRLQISQNRPVSVSEMQAAQVESFRFQAQKIDNTDKAGAPADDQPVKKKRKKKRKLEGRDSDSAASKRELGAEDSSKLNSHPEDAGGAKKAASLPSAARLNIPQIIPANKIVASPGAGKAQLLGVSAGNLGDIKFIQLPGQGGILQLVPANVFGIKASPDGKNGPNYVAVPLLGPIGLAGAKKTGVSAQTHTPTGTSTPIGESLAGKDGTAPSDPDQLQGLRVTPAQNISRDAPSASTVSELKDIAETESSVVSRKSDNSSLTFAVPATASLMSANPSQCVASHASNVMDSFSGPVSLASGISNLSSVSSSAAGGSIVSQKPDGQRLPYAVPAFYDPNDEPAERASRGAHRFPGYTSAAHGIIPNTFVVASRVGVSGAGKGVEGSKPASPVTTSESGHAKTAPSLPKGNPTERSTCKKSDTAGERPGVGKSPIGSASLDIAGPSVPASSISGLSGFESSGQFDAYPVRLVKNQMAGEDNTRGSGSSFSDDDIDILLSEVDEDGEDGSIDSDKEKQQCAPCPQCYNSTASGKTLRMCEVCKNSSGTKLKRSEHSLRERHYRAQCARMIKYLREILFAADPALKSTSNHIAKAKLVSKAALVVKYQQKLSVSLKRGLSVEKQRHSMLQRQLNSKLESLRKEGVSAEAISSILSSITLPSLPQASASSQVHAGEKELLHAECAPGSGATDLPASSSAKSTHSFTTSPSPWQVGSYTNSGKPGGGEMPVVAKSTSSASQDRNTSRRRKSEKPVKHWTVNKSSDFVIEIERAEEDENFVDEEESADLTQKQPNMKPSEHENFQDKQRFGDDDTEQRLESEHQKLEKTSVVKDVPPLGCNAKTPSRVSEEKEECDSPVYPALSDCTYEKQQANKSSVHHGASCAVNNEQAVSSGTTNLDKDLASSELEKHAPCEDQDMENEEANLESECVIPVITSVTSLQNTDINFEDGDIVTPLLQNVDTEA